MLHVKVFVVSNISRELNVIFMLISFYQCICVVQHATSISLLTPAWIFPHNSGLLFKHKSAFLIFPFSYFTKLAYKITFLNFV